MKILIENWRSFVNEEDEQEEGKTSVSQEDINDLFDGHASGRPIDDKLVKSTINEVEATEEGYDQVLQDFIAVHNNIDKAIANEKSALSQLEQIASKETFTKYIDKAAANLKRYVTEIGNLSDLINTGKFPNYKRVEVDGKIRFINTGFKRARRYGRYETSEEVARDRLEDLNNRYTELVDKILTILTIIKRVLTSAFGDNTDRIENYYKAVSAIKLFTGESVKTVRKPEGFEAERAKLISNSSRMVSGIAGTLQGLDIVPRPFLPDFRSVYEDRNRDYLDLKTEIGMMARNITPTKFDYEFAKGFLTYTGKNSPVLFVQQGTTIYRGVNSDEAKYLKYKNMEPGTVKTYHDIVSWSADIKVAKSFAFGENDTRKAKPYAIILQTKATRGIYVEEYSKFPDEKEVICGGNIKLVAKRTFDVTNARGTVKEGLILEFEYE